MKVILDPSDEGGYTVTVPALPGCISEGDTREDALENIREAIQLYLERVEEAKSMIVPMQGPVEDRGKTGYEHVVLQGSVPVIAGTTMKVTELVSEVMAYGWSPEELHFQHPYLTMGQIHSALAYYWDHAEELDREIERSLEFVDQLRRSAGPSPLRARLKAKGLL